MTREEQKITNMDTLTAFSVIALAALIHASFQLSVSVVTMLSGHSAGKRDNPHKSLRLVGAFLAGVITTTALLTFTVLYKVSTLGGWYNSTLVWTMLCGVLVGVGLAVWAVYYRYKRNSGTSLWIPRAFARFLDKRVKSTTLGAESFSLGLTTVIAELPFIIAPLAAAALAMASLPLPLQLYGALSYIVIASFSIFIVTVLIGSGHNISHIQRWREHNKRFLQFTSGAGLIILGGFLYVTQVVTPIVVAGGTP